MKVTIGKQKTVKVPLSDEAGLIVKVLEWPDRKPILKDLLANGGIGSVDKETIEALKAAKAALGDKNPKWLEALDVAINKLPMIDANPEAFVDFQDAAVGVSVDGWYGIVDEDDEDLPFDPPLVFRLPGYPEKVASRVTDAAGFNKEEDAEKAEAEAKNSPST